MSYIDNAIHLADGTANPDWYPPSVTTFAGDNPDLRVWVECDGCSDLWDVVGVDNTADAETHLNTVYEGKSWTRARDGKHYCPDCKPGAGV